MVHKKARRGRPSRRAKFLESGQIAMSDNLPLQKLQKPSRRARGYALSAHLSVSLKLRVEFHRIGFQCDAQDNQFVSVAFLFSGAGVLSFGAYMLRIGTGVLPVCTGVLKFGAVKAIFRSLRELLHRALNHFLFNVQHFVLPSIRVFVLQLQAFGSMKLRGLL